MNRAASHFRQAGSPIRQAGEGSSGFETAYDDTGLRQPVDPFEDVPRGISHEEVGFGSLAFEDSVIVERPGDERPSRTLRGRAGSSDEVARLRLARAFASS